jgi:hypothetical protein
MAWSINPWVPWTFQENKEQLLLTVGHVQGTLFLRDFITLHNSLLGCILLEKPITAICPL